MTTRTPKLVTKDSLKELLQCGNPEKIMHTVGKALVVLYNNQELDEQYSKTVAHNNGIGFTRGDARAGTEAARYYLANKRLPAVIIRYWTVEEGFSCYPYLCKYDRQLNDAALAKQAAKIENDLEKL
jgi:hypothetical protein